MAAMTAVVPLHSLACWAPCMRMPGSSSRMAAWSEMHTRGMSSPWPLWPRTVTWIRSGKAADQLANCWLMASRRQ